MTDFITGEIDGNKRDVQAALEAAATPRSIYSNEKHVVLALPPGWQTRVEDLEKIQPVPYRQCSTTVTADGSSFANAVGHQSDPDVGVVIYKDPRPGSMALAAVLNHGTSDQPGWGDHLVLLVPVATPEWDSWKTAQGLKPQGTFIDFLEEHTADIVEPDAATMLELASTFRAANNVQFKAGVNVQADTVQFSYDEESTPSAGSSGQLVVPRTFSIAVRPFVGADPFRIDAMLRYRVDRGGLQIGYTLPAVDRVERTVFDEMVDTARSELVSEHDFIIGTAPTNT